MSGYSITQVSYRCLTAAQFLLPAVWLAAFWKGFIVLRDIERRKSTAAFVFTVAVFAVLLTVIFLFSSALYDRESPIIY